MQAKWLKKVPIPTILVGGLVIGVMGKLPGAGNSVSDKLAPLNTWSDQHAASPGLAMFFLGCLVTWLLHQIAAVWLSGRRKRVRIRLADLRKDGVRLRIDGGHISNEADVSPWVDKVEKWDRQVVAAIARIDEADSRQYATLDFPGRARTDPRYVNEAHAQNYIMHDARLVRLAELMTRYSAQTA